MEEREYTVDELSSPYEEGMSNEVSPTVQYYAEGGSVDERGLFSQQIPQRPQVQQQQQAQPPQLKRTAAEMLQRMPQVSMGTMRFSPLTMPGVSGRPVQQFADGGAVSTMTPEERLRIEQQASAGAPVDNLFGANLTTPGPAPLPSFTTNIPTFNPVAKPMTGPVSATGTALGEMPTGLGTAPTFTYAGTQQAPVPPTTGTGTTTGTTGTTGTTTGTTGAAKSLFEQLTPSTLGAAPYSFKTGTTYTPTEQYFTKPELISKSEAELLQPKLVRYEPDIKFGGLTSYKGPLQTSPYTSVAGADASTATPTTPQWQTYGFTEPASGAGSAEPTFWYNRNLGVSFTAPTGGFVPPSADWTGRPISDVFKPGEEDTLTGGEGNDTVTGGAGADQVNWADAAAFPVGTFTTPTERPKVNTLEDVFSMYGGTGVLPAFRAEGEGPVGMLASMAKGFQSSKYGWDKNTQSFNLTPTAVSNILQSKTFKTAATGTVNNMLSELGYTIGGKTTTGTNYSKADRDNLVNMLTSGTADMTRVANLITSPLRKADALTVTRQNTPTLFNIYTNAGILRSPTRTTSTGGGGAATGGGGAASTSVGTTGTTGTTTTTTSSPRSGSGLFGSAFSQSRSSAPSSIGGLFGRTRAEGSPPEGEYADPVEAIRERQRMRREMGTMDQGSARDRLKKFSGGEDLAPVQEFSKGGIAKKAAELLKGLGVAESKVAGKELTTLQDANTSLGDSIRERMAKMQQQMDTMEFKYGPGQRVFTESGAKKNLSPLEIKAKRLYGDIPMREPHPDNPLLGKVIKDPETGRAKRTPYEPGYLVRREGPDGQWSEFVIPQSVIKGSVDGFAKGGPAVKGGNTPISYQDALAFQNSEVGSQIPRIERLLRPSNWNNLSSGLKKQYLNEIQGAMNDPVNYSLNQLKKDAAGYTVYQGLPGGGGTAKAEARDLKSNIDRYSNFLQSSNQPQERIASTANQGYVEGTKQLQNSVRRMNDEPVLNRISDVALQLGLGAATSGLSLPGQIAANAALQLGQGRKPMDAFKDVPRAGGSYLSRGLFGNTMTPPSFAHGGMVHRAEGSPVYGEVADTGGVTPETIAALRNRQGLSATEALNALKKIYGEGISNAESVLRGSAAAIPGAFGDIESLFRQSDKTRKLATTEEVLRDYMPKRVTKPTKETAGFEETGTYMPLPIPTSAVKKAGAVAKTGARKALEELGPTAAGMAERQLQKSGLGPMYAVKPGGGTFFPASAGSSMDDYLENIVKGLSKAETLTGKDAKSVADFIRTKGRKYLTTSYGTSNDPLRTALAEGRLPRFGRDKEKFRDYLLQAARADIPEATQDLEKFYDKATGIRAMTYIPEGAGSMEFFSLPNKAKEAQKAKMLAEGVSEEMINLPTTSGARLETLGAKYATESEKNLAEIIKTMEGLPPEAQKTYMQGLGEAQPLAYAAKKGEAIYDIDIPSLNFLNPTNVAESIASIPLSELERMTFPEALVKGEQNLRLKRDFQAVIKNAEEGKPVPKEIFFSGTKPVYELDKSKQWVRIMTPDAVQLEGAAMRHSIGGYKTSNSYNLGGKDAFNSGLARIFSLRNEKGVPQVTIETKFTDEGGLEVTQGGVRSKFNSKPTATEKSAVFQLFDTLGPKAIRSTKYTRDRSGDALKEDEVIDWGQEYADYLKYKNKGEE